MVRKNIMIHIKKYHDFNKKTEELKFRKKSYVGMMEENRQRMLSNKDIFEYYLRMRQVFRTFKQLNSN